MPTTRRYDATTGKIARQLALTHRLTAPAVASAPTDTPLNDQRTIGDLAAKRSNHPNEVLLGRQPPRIALSSPNRPDRTFRAGEPASMSFAGITSARPPGLTRRFLYAVPDAESDNVGPASDPFAGRVLANSEIRRSGLCIAPICNCEVRCQSFFQVCRYFVLEL